MTSEDSVEKDHRFAKRSLMIATGYFGVYAAGSIYSGISEYTLEWWTPVVVICLLMGAVAAKIIPSERKVTA